ncbi:MAG: hypothetical protein K5753_02670 [Clostridia bacterium]|nr:hypothetical protein [Clostridia bacterium]
MHTIVARFSGDASNYNAIADMTSTLLINKAAYDLSGVTFEGASFLFGKESRSQFGKTRRTA